MGLYLKRSSFYFTIKVYLFIQITISCNSHPITQDVIITKKIPNDMSNLLFTEIPILERDPLFNKKINPLENQAINPEKNSLLNPKSNSSLNPNENISVNPMINEKIHPGINKEWSYMDNKNINPNLNQQISPSYSEKFNPNSKEFEGIYIFNTNGFTKEFGYNVSPEIYLIYNTEFEFIKIAVSNKNNGFNLFNIRHEWLGFMIPDGNGGYLLFNTNSTWEYYAR
jgi:hypothetical protein